MKEHIGRREFLRKAGVAALAIPAILNRTSENSHAANESSTDAARGSKAKTKRIAVEEHWMLPTGKPPVLPPSNDPEGMKHVFPLLANFEARFPLMEESGITMQVLMPGGALRPQDAAAVVALAKKFNDAQVEIIAKYPGRFAGYASLPTVDPKAAADELERAVTQLGLKRGYVAGSVNGEYLDEQKFWPIWERAEGLGVPIYLHPLEPPAYAMKMYEGHSELTGPGWSWTVDTATHALRIIGAGVFDAFPKTTLILGHLGESLPYLLGRLDEGYTISRKTRKLKKLFSEYIRENIVVTTSGRYRPETLVCAISAMGADRVLFAVDYPFAEMKEAVQQIESAGLSDVDKEKIYHLNAERWLRL
ncbi:MAG TPA: amidohydrolase family protein [Syntrophorhabdales bacterium]|nr:amidohydrolase family protein [Syntrophorhabdales bacterium]